MCVLNQRVDMLLLFGMACLVLLAFNSFLMQQLSLIAAQSSMEHYRRLGGREAIFHPKFGLTTSLCFYRILSFLITGQYTITAVYHDESDSEDKYGLINNNSNSSNSSSSNNHDNQKEDKNKINTEERQEEFLLQNRGGGPEVDYSDDDELREWHQKMRMKNKKCCNNPHHSHDSEDRNEAGTSTGTNNSDERQPNAMQMNFNDRV